MHSDVHQLKIFKSGFQSEKYYAGVKEILCRGRRNKLQGQEKYNAVAGKEEKSRRA